MGQKSSKKTDLYVTDDVTHCKLPESDVTKYVGRAREYTAVDVVVEKPVAQDKEDGSPKKRSSTHENPDSILHLLHRAHRKSYQLAFIVPKVKGSRPSNLNRNSLVEENPEDGDATKHDDHLTHTVFLWRPKVKARLKKEMSLKKMEAKKTFLNMMMDIQHKWIFTVKEFESEMSKIESGEYVEKLHEMISNEAAKGGRLLSVMRVDHDVIKENGVSNGTGGGGEGEDGAPAKKPNKLTLRMVFLHKNSDKAKRRFHYNVKCVRMNCTEEKIKVKKKQKTKLPRETNVTWSENWLELMEEDSRITEVINVGELHRQEEDNDAKGKKKPKKREFQVMTLCFHEKPVAKDNNDNNDAAAEDDDDEDPYEPPVSYESLVREVWAPIDDSVQQNLEQEAERFGENGWELCTVLVTSHVRMKADGGEFRKCAIFFQRPKGEFVPDNEKSRSSENLIQGGNVSIEETHDPETEMLEPENVPPTSPKEKVERFGVALMPQVDLNQAKLRTAKASPQKTKEADAVISGLAGVQLKKVKKEEAKKPEVQEEKKEALMPQVKLRKTEPKQEKLVVAEPEVPWMNSLERKREAVMKSEDKPKTPDAERKTEGAEEIARKIDEIKEKRAQRQNRVSIHREEEKRKSLEAEKRKSMEEEKRKSDVVAAAVAVVSVQEEEKQNEPTPTEAPDVSPPVAEEAAKEAVPEDLPPPVVEEPPTDVPEEVAPEQEVDVAPAASEDAEEPKELPLPPPVVENGADPSMESLEDALAEFDQQLDATETPGGAVDSAPQTEEVAEPKDEEETQPEDPCKEEEEQESSDPDLPVPPPPNTSQSALSSLHLPSPPPPDQEDALTPLEEEKSPPSDDSPPPDPQEDATTSEQEPVEKNLPPPPPEQDEEQDEPATEAPTPVYPAPEDKLPKHEEPTPQKDSEEGVQPQEDALPPPMEDATEEEKPPEVEDQITTEPDPPAPPPPQEEDPKTENPLAPGEEQPPPPEELPPPMEESPPPPEEDLKQSEDLPLPCDLPPPADDHVVTDEIPHPEDTDNEANTLPPPPASPGKASETEEPPAATPTEQHAGKEGSEGLPPPPSSGDSAPGEDLPPAPSDNDLPSPPPTS